MLSDIFIIINHSIINRMLKEQSWNNSILLVLVFVVGRFQRIIAI